MRSIKLYRKENSPQVDGIEAEFREMVLGYDRVVIDVDDDRETCRAKGNDKLDL